jgi:transcriptional regulator GlxA family with amidase domain
MLYGHACEIDCSDLPAIKNDFSELIQKSSDSSASAYLERNRLMLSLLQPFMRIFDKNPRLQTSLRHQSLLPSLSIMNREIADPPSLKSLAEAANMSPEHFSRKFKNAFNVSPKRYMLHKRIAFAKQRLLSEHKNIDEVAEQSGFCDIFHFSRTFKKETGLSPSQFRKIYRTTQ